MFKLVVVALTLLRHYQKFIAPTLGPPAFLEISVKEKLLPNQYTYSLTIR